MYSKVLYHGITMFLDKYHGKTKVCFEAHESTMQTPWYNLW